MNYSQVPSVIQISDDLVMLLRPRTSSTRLIIPFTSQNCCSSGIGIGLEDRVLPQKLKDLGVKEEEWSFFMEKLEKDGHIGKDDLARAEKELEKITGDHVAKIDELLKHKESELLEV